MRKMTLISTLIVILLALNGVFAQQQASGEVKEFKVNTGEVLDFKELRSINESPSDRDQPGFVTVSQRIEDGKKAGEAVFQKYMDHAGKDEFFEKVRMVINSWDFNDEVKAQGTIFYTVATNGTIKVDLRSVNLPDYVNFKFATADLLVKIKGFDKQNVRALMQKGQKFGAVKESFLSKLGTTYVIIFSIILVIFVLSIVFTFKSTSSKLEPKEKNMVDIVSKLWINNALKLEKESTTESGEKITIERSVDEDNPDLDDEVTFIKELAAALKDGTIEKKDKEAIPEGYSVPIDYKKLGENMLKMLEGKDSPDDKIEAITNIESLIWRDYSVLFIQKAKDICIENKDYRISRIFLAGLENHLNNKDAWYTSSEIDRAVDKTAASELEQMKGWIDGLWVVGSVSPMFGLFGTVTGISSAFAEISHTSAGMEQAELITNLAGGINTALWTTIVGLAIGLTATLVYYAFKVRLDSTSTKWEELFVDITNNF